MRMLCNVPCFKISSSSLHQSNNRLKDACWSLVVGQQMRMFERTKMTLSATTGSDISELRALYVSAAIIIRISISLRIQARPSPFPREFQFFTIRSFPVVVVVGWSSYRGKGWGRSLTVKRDLLNCTLGPEDRNKPGR